MVYPALGTALRPDSCTWVELRSCGCGAQGPGRLAIDNQGVAPGPPRPNEGKQPPGFYRRLRGTRLIGSETSVSPFRACELPLQRHEFEALNTGFLRPTVTCVRRPSAPTLHPSVREEANDSARAAAVTSASVSGSAPAVALSRTSASQRRAPNRAIRN